MELMRISNDGIALIKQYEGCKLTAYKPVATEKYFTIGIGHYGADVKQGMTITERKAEELFCKDIAPIEQALNSLNINFKQQQFDALVSWIFNLGIGNFNSSTMKKYIIARKSDIEITDQLVQWHKSNGKPLLGLMRRRCDEANMWLGQSRYKVDNNGKITK